MTRKSEYSSKIQLLANRIRCSICNADSSECIFIISNDIRFRYSFTKATLPEPAYIRGNPPKMRINKTQTIGTNEFLTRLCLRCGTARKTSIPNN